MAETTPNNFYSPLRYPGGKTKLAPFLKALFDENNLVGRHYIEPFAGGAGVALSLLFDGYVSGITINDLDRSVYAFWHSVVYMGDEFCKRVSNTPINMKTWEKQREIQRHKEEVSVFDLGFSTFFLNRTNVSGVLKGGVIGGKDQKGKYKLGERFNKESLIERIRRVGEYRDKIKVTNEDAVEIVQSDFSNGEFVYLDPPYVNKAKGLYLNFYGADDHQKIARVLLGNKSNFFWVLSYDCSDLVRSCYGKCKNKLSWETNYGASKRKSEEDIFLHPKLKFGDAQKVLCNCGIVDKERESKAN